MSQEETKQFKEQYVVEQNNTENTENDLQKKQRIIGCCTILGITLGQINEIELTLARRKMLNRKPQASDEIEKAYDYLMKVIQERREELKKRTEKTEESRKKEAIEKAIEYFS